MKNYFADFVKKEETINYIDFIFSLNEKKDNSLDYIINFIGTRTVSKKELKECLLSIQKTTGKRPTWGWLKKQSSTVESIIDENNNQSVFFRLTKNGLKKLAKNAS